MEGARGGAAEIERGHDDVAQVPGTDLQVVEPLDVQAAGARRPVCLQHALFLEPGRLGDAFVDHDVRRARVDEKVVRRPVDRDRHVEMPVAQRHGDRRRPRHVDRARRRRYERSRRNGCLGHDRRRDADEVEGAIAVRDDAVEREPVPVDGAPVGQVDRRPAVVVVVGHPIGQARPGIEIDRLRLAALRRHVQHIGVTAVDLRRSAVCRALGFLRKVARLDEVVGEAAPVEDAAQLPDVAVAVAQIEPGAAADDRLATRPEHLVVAVAVPVVPRRERSRERIAGQRTRSDVAVERLGACFIDGRDVLREQLRHRRRRRWRRDRRARAYDEREAQERERGRANVLSRHRRRGSPRGSLNAPSSPPVPSGRAARGSDGSPARRQRRR